MTNAIIIPTTLKTRAIIAIIADVPILNDTLGSFFCKTEVIPTATPTIPEIRLEIVKAIVNKAAILFESALTNKINKIDKIEIDDKIQDNVINRRDAIIFA